MPIPEPITLAQARRYNPPSGHQEQSHLWATGEARKREMEAECPAHKCHSSGPSRTLAWEKGLAKGEGVYSGLSGQQRPCLAEEGQRMAQRHSSSRGARDCPELGPFPTPPCAQAGVRQKPPEPKRDGKALANDSPNSCPLEYQRGFGTTIS